jgi:hypothetical protein
MDRVTAKGLETRIETIAAFAAIYIIWGSTFIAIRFAIETIPPFLMAGTRLVLAGLPLFLWGLLRGRTLPSAADWLRAAPVGALLFLSPPSRCGWRSSTPCTPTVGSSIAGRWRGWSSDSSASDCW